MPATTTIHLLGNAHLDPVWLWDWKEGLNQGLITCRTVLDMMDEYPDLTFNRGEASIYQHIERTDPQTFARIKDYVEAGRWDIVGGTFVQPDDNMPATEPFVRQYTRGLNYFASRFGVKVEVAWSADCFGHAEGMPEVLGAAGIKYFAFTRPENNFVAIPKPAFQWVGPGGSRILCYRPTFGWYGTNRDEMTGRLDAALTCATEAGLQNIGCLYGLGDHGGGPSRRLLAEIKRWAGAHPQVKVVHSTMHRYFSELEREVAAYEPSFLPERHGELNFCLRGCYSTMAKFKFLYRKAESALCVAERTDAVISAKLNRRPADLVRTWDTMLFNAFHDILPGTSIERAFDDQIGQLHAVLQDADAAQFAALNALSAQVDTRVVPVDKNSDMPTGVAALVWNPHPRAFEGFVEFEACLDDRQINQYRDQKADLLPVRILDHAKNPLPFQSVAVENRFALFVPWRKRALIPMKLPPMGWSVVEMAWFENALPPARPSGIPEAQASAEDSTHGSAAALIVSNGIYRIQALKGSRGIAIVRDGKPLLSGAGLGAAVFADHSGSWGSDSIDSISADVSEAIETWTITETRILEKGPWRAAMWVRLAGRRSRLDLTIQVYAGQDAVNVQARAMWDERSARLNLVLPFEGDGSEFDVCGARVKRADAGDVPGGKWVRVAARDPKACPLGFASDAIYGFNVGRHQFHATVVRSTRYSSSNEDAMPPEAQPWIPATDVGELKFRFVISAGDQRLADLADGLCEQPIVLGVASKAGPLAGRGELMSLQPAGLRLLAFKQAEDGNGWVLRVAETTGQTQRPRLTLMGKIVDLEPVEANQIATYRISSKSDGFVSTSSDVSERVESVQPRGKAGKSIASRQHQTA